LLKLSPILSTFTM